MTKICIGAFVLCLLCPACFGQGLSTLPVDLIVDMNTSTPGTALTTTIANAGTICKSGTTCTWSSIASGGSFLPTFLVGANQNTISNLGPVTLTGGTTYPAQSLNYNSIGHQDGDPGAGSNAQLDVTGTGATKVSALLGLVLNLPTTESNPNDLDMAILWQNPNGNYAALQLNAQTAGTACVGIPSGTVGIRLEGKPTTHTPCIPLVTPGSYWATWTWDLTVGSMTLYMYTAGGTPVKCISGVGGGTSGGVCNSDGSVTLTGTNTGGTLGYMTIGNNEIGSNNGTITYFQDIMLNWTTAPQPMFWTTGTQPQPPTNVKASTQ